MSMLKNVGWVGMLVSLALAFQGCATLEVEPRVVAVDTGPVVSKTLEAAPVRSLKRKVAIARFSNETRYGQGFFHDENNDRIGKQAMDILSAKLAATEKFILLERADVDKINDELKIGGLGGLNIPADYLIVGSVSEFGRKEISEVGVFSRVKKQVAFARVNIRLIDVTSGQIIYSEEGEGEAFTEAGTVMGVGGRAAYDSSLNDKAIDAAISKMVSNVVENLLNKPWRAYILSYDDGSYIVSGGQSQGILAGDTFAVYQKGKLVKNPQTNLMIELPGKKIGTIQVATTVGTEPNSEVSICSPLDGQLPVKDFDNLYVQEN